MAQRVLGSTADLLGLRAQLETLVAAGEHAQVTATLFEILERVMRVAAIAKPDILSACSRERGLPARRPAGRHRESRALEP